MRNYMRNYLGKDIKINFGGISFSGILTIVFIVLKLTNVISWSWLWVLSPLWIDILIIVVLLIICILILLIKKLLS